MGKKWGSNEDIHVGDIFRCWSTWGGEVWEYYQVVELRGKSQVVLHAIYSECFINEGISEDSPLFWRRERTRPVPGKFADLNHPVERRVYCIQGGYLELTTEKLTAWVCPERYDDGTYRLQAMGMLYKKWGLCFNQELPKSWAVWDAETIRKLEEYERLNDEALSKSLRGEEDVVWPEYPI